MLAEGLKKILDNMETAMAHRPFHSLPMLPTVALTPQSEDLALPMNLFLMPPRALLLHYLLAEAVLAAPEAGHQAPP